MATNTYLVITDGTTTATIADGSGGSVSGNYRLVDESWAPAVAGLRRSPFGGVGPYEDVAESMEVAVSGSTVAACLSYISTLTNLLHQAERWYRGENVSAVTVRYSPRGATVSSAGSPLQAVILGRAGDAIITLPPTLDDGNAYKAGVRLNFVRRGLWLHTTQTGSASGNNGDVVTIAMSGSTAVNSPTKIHWTNNNAGSIAITEYIVYSNAPSGITVREAETLGGFTVASGSAQLARGGSIIQSNLLPGFTEAASSTLSAGSSTRRFGILANAYQSSGTTGLMRVGISSSAATAASSCYTPWVQPSTSGRTWTPVGILAIDGQATYIALQTYAPSGSPVILVDSLVLVDLDQGGIIGVVRNNSSSITTEAAVIDHKYVEWPTPMVQGGAGSYGYSMQTSAYAGTSSGSVYMCLLQNFGGSPGALNWRAASASGSLLTNTWTITRTVGYVTPV